MKKSAFSGATLSKNAQNRGDTCPCVVNDPNISFSLPQDDQSQTCLSSKGIKSFNRIVYK